MSDEYRDLMWQEVEAIGEFLHEIDDDEFDKPSLCEGWNVRDVIGHMAYGHTTTIGPVLKGTVKYKMNIDKGSFELSKGWAAQRSPDEIRTFWDDVMVGQHPRKGIALFIKDRDGFVDHLIHHQDMRRPLGRLREIPSDRLRMALESLSKVQGPMFGTKKPTAGLRLVATDVDWSAGQGPTVEGPGEAIIMASAGRKVALDDLSGDGVATLAQRITKD